MSLANARAIAYIALSCGRRSGCDGGSGRRPGAARAGERPQSESPAWGDAMCEIVIASAARTPVGAFNGGLSSVAAHQRGQGAIPASPLRAGVGPGAVAEANLGEV